MPAKLPASWIVPENATRPISVEPVMTEFISSVGFDSVLSLSRMTRFLSCQWSAHGCTTGLLGLLHVQKLQHLGRSTSQLVSDTAAQPDCR